MLEQTNRQSTGWVEHHTGTTVVSASTREWGIKQQLYSTTDTNAIHNIGRVLARRCLESGITEVYTELDQYAENSTKVKREGMQFLILFLLLVVLFKIWAPADLLLVR